MLRITEYCPEMADSLLSTIIDRAIQIDVGVVISFRMWSGQLMELPG